jgi:hypothetical protein
VVGDLIIWNYTKKIIKKKFDFQSRMRYYVFIKKTKGKIMKNYQLDEFTLIKKDTKEMMEIKMLPCDGLMFKVYLVLDLISCRNKSYKTWCESHRFNDKDPGHQEYFFFLKENIEKIKKFLNITEDDLVNCQEDLDKNRYKNNWHDDDYLDNLVEEKFKNIKVIRSYNISLYL